ncbi:MAG: IS66 family insertion sequence element accessory protein TnpB [Pirellula staleyi]
MIPFPMRVYLYTRDTDMRRSFNGLVGIIQSEFKMDILKGDMFLFLSKRRDRIKAIWWDGDGMAIYMKRLEVGVYQRPLIATDGCCAIIDRTQLRLLLSGIEIRSAKRLKRYQSSTTDASSGKPEHRPKQMHKRLSTITRLRTRPHPRSQKPRHFLATCPL